MDVQSIADVAIDATSDQPGRFSCQQTGFRITDQANVAEALSRERAHGRTRTIAITGAYARPAYTRTITPMRVRVRVHVTRTITREHAQRVRAYDHAYASQCMHA